MSKITDYLQKSIDFVAVGNEFVVKHDARKVNFGKFVASDLST